ncbi:MAG TPA: PsiF family protein [Burkholderiaceae bacterium]|nr:PsiF family protein [Burkholderiaceae bacterium]
MKYLIAAVLCSVAATSWANDSCAARATEKKLAGAAKTSFMKKCESDARTACSTQASDKKLAGAAKNSFFKKCVSDSVGS